MKNFIILIIQLFGYVSIFVSGLSFLNYMFDWRLGYKGSEVPGDPVFAGFFLVMGLVISAVGWFLGRKFPA